MQSYDPVALAQTRDPFDFHEFASFNDASFPVFRGDGVEASDWERHRTTDEFHRNVSDLMEMYFTPGESEQSDVDDPRNV